MITKTIKTIVITVFATALTISAVLFTEPQKLFFDDNTFTVSSLDGNVDSARIRAMNYFSQKGLRLGKAYIVHDGKVVYGKHSVEFEFYTEELALSKS